MNLHIVCPTCLSTNRVPSKRLKEEPNCGKCKNDLFSIPAIEADFKTFSKITKKSDLTVIIDFWAPWCGPCKAMEPIFNIASSQLIGEYILIKINTEQEKELSSSLGIRSIPTLMAYKDGQEINRLSGAMQLPQLLQWIREN